MQSKTHIWDIPNIYEEVLMQRPVQLVRLVTKKYLKFICFGKENLEMLTKYCQSRDDCIEDMTFCIYKSETFDGHGNIDLYYFYVRFKSNISGIIKDPIIRYIMAGCRNGYITIPKEDLEEGIHMTTRCRFTVSSPFPNPQNPKPK